MCIIILKKPLCKSKYKLNFIDVLWKQCTLSCRAWCSSLSIFQTFALSFIVIPDLCLGVVRVQDKRQNHRENNHRLLSPLVLLVCLVCCPLYEGSVLCPGILPSSDKSSNIPATFTLPMKTCSFVDQLLGIYRPSY